MGIPGLLKELNAIIGKDAHISAYRGKRVAVDASGWLHRSLHCCALELLLNVPTTAHVTVLRTLLLALLDHEVEPVVVFDGAHLPAKEATDAARDAHRRRHRELALLYNSSATLELAQHHAQQAVVVTPAVTHAFLELCREYHVEVLVAPAEADAQMAHLCQTGNVHACLTEDSDLVPFGCDRLFVKLERTGAGRELILSDLPLQVTDDAFIRRLQRVYMRGHFLGMCVLSGCDYLPSLQGMGLRTAAKLWCARPSIELICHQLKHDHASLSSRRKKKHKTNHLLANKQRTEEAAVSEEKDDKEEDAQDDSAECDDVLLLSDEEGSENQGRRAYYDDYAFDYHKALLTFRHQLIYDTRTAQYAYLSPLPPAVQRLSPFPADRAHVDAVVAVADGADSLTSRLSMEAKHHARLTSLDFLGRPPPAHLATAVLQGRVHPKTLKPHVHEAPSIQRFFTELKNTEQAEQTSAGQQPLMQHSPAPPSSPSPLTIASPTGRAPSKRKTKRQLEHERRGREERRATGGGLLRHLILQHTS